MKKEGVLLIVLAVIAVAFFLARGSRISRTINDLDHGGRVTSAPISPTEGPLAQEIPLTVFQPQNNSVVTTTNIIVSGKTAPGADVLVNDIELKADSQGNFSTSYLLDLGNNIISVVANDQSGNYSEKELTVTLADTGTTVPQ